MGTKKITMTTTQHREQQKTLRQMCVSEAIRAGAGPHHQRIIDVARHIESYINTGKVK